MDTLTARRLAQAFVRIVLAAVAMAAIAQDVERTDAGSRKLTKDAIIDALFVDLAAAGKRGIQPRRVLSISVKFDRNSARLTREAKDTLLPLGEALGSDYLAPQAFTVEGHTDITGRRDYNLWLSKQRALAVKTYLTDEFDLKPTQLKAVGRGPDDLLDKDDPTNGANRRVEIATRYE